MINYFLWLQNILCNVLDTQVREVPWMSPHHHTFDITGRGGIIDAWKTRRKSSKILALNFTKKCNGLEHTVS